MLAHIKFKKIGFYVLLITMLSLSMYSGLFDIYINSNNKSVVGKIVIVSDLNIKNKIYLEKIVTTESGKGFWYMDLANLNTALLGLPWVEYSSVRRIWPGTLSIKLRHEVPVARWGDDTLLSNNGNVWSFESWKNYDSGIKIDALPVLSGPIEYKNELAQRFSEFSTLFVNFNVYLRKLSLSTRGTWKIELSNNVKVELGRGQLVEKMKKFLVFYNAQINSNFDQVDYVDLRYTNGFAVKYKDQSLLANDVLP